MNVRVVLVGGGTGGHFYPLIAITEALGSAAQATGATLELFYMGPDPYDKQSLDAYGITFVKVSGGKTRRYRSLLNVFDIFKTLWGIVEAVCKLFWIYPDVVMSKGGFTSVPVVLAAWFLRIPIVVHESDSVPGRANSLGAKFARYIAISYPEVAERFKNKKVALTGIPIRKVFLEPSTEDPHNALGIDPTYPLILVIGGSLGAERVNTLVLQALDELLPKYTIIHQTGASHIDAVLESAKTIISDQSLLSRYHPAGFIDSAVLVQAYRAAAIVVARGGSTSIFEIALAGKPSIIIPIPEEISHDQRTNAYAYARSGAATVMEEANLQDGLLAGEIMRIMDDHTVYEEMAAAAKAFAPRDAAEKLANILLAIGAEH
jgi:UDP-N-acetylglucosamine--N-acetylmuramyl-(pentapeptide) pyrophosphoryl-undecaprenol N-acetylglucosamine transferase